ncbi:MAG: VOC family protein, partial [Candidatus Dormibacteraeota bacterium]|nr:VOC family protein [Candidatus Dormibacteraeota bacterium]
PRSGRDPIDLERLFQELTAEDGLDAALPGDTKMGHVHLHIRDVDEAVKFYRDLVGFDVKGFVPQMGLAFVSAGGYHHHLGLNEWAGRGVPPAPPDTAGLRHFTIEVPTGSELLDIVGRLGGAGIAVEERDDGYLAADPSSNAVLLCSRDNRRG